MQVTVTDLSSVKKTLHIEIPHGEVQKELEKAYNQIKRTARIKGFRPGKVPRSVLVRMFKKDVHADVSSRLIQESFVEALKETELHIIGNPQLDPPELKENEAYHYDATVEVKPKLDEIDFKGLELKKSVYSISDEEIELQLKALQKNLAKQKPIDEVRPAAEGDIVFIDYEGLHDGKPHPETQATKDFNTKIGSGRILKEFDEGLIGMQPGDAKQIKVTFPEDYFNSKLAGLEIEFFVTLKEIREEELPEIDDAMAKQAGNYETLDELKTQIRENLKNGYAKRSEQELNEQIFQALIDKNEFEIPESMVEFELNHIIEDAERSFAYRNTSFEEMGLTRESIAEKYRDTAIKQVQRHLILDKIIDQESIELTDEELDIGFDELSASFGQPVETIKKYYKENDDKLEYFKHTLLEKKAIKLILEGSEVREEERTGELEETSKPDNAAG